MARTPPTASDDAAAIVSRLVPTAASAAAVRAAVARALAAPTVTKADFAAALRRGRGTLAPKGAAVATTQRDRIDAAWAALVAARAAGLSGTVRAEALASAVVTAGPLDGPGRVQRVLTFPRAGPRSQVRFIYNSETKTLYIEFYEVDPGLAGRHLGTDFLRLALAEAERHGPVEVVTGKAGQDNAQKLLTAGGKLDPSRVDQTPWARAWAALGWTTQLRGTVLTTTRT